MVSKRSSSTSATFTSIKLDKMPEIVVLKGVMYNILCPGIVVSATPAKILPESPCEIFLQIAGFLIRNQVCAEYRLFVVCSTDGYGRDTDGFRSLIPTVIG